MDISFARADHRRRARSRVHMRATVTAAWGEVRGEVLELSRDADLPLADAVAGHARRTALGVLDGKTEVEVLIFDREGRLAGRADA